MTDRHDRILVTHAGTLPRSKDLRDLVYARANGKAYDADMLTAMIRQETAEVVRRQVECGIDIVNDGEVGKTNFTNYIKDRIAGIEQRESAPDDIRARTVSGRDELEFADYFQAGGGSWFGAPRPTTRSVCVDELRYVGFDELKAELADFRTALEGVTVGGAFLSGNTPGTIEHWLGNDYYPTEEAFVYAIAECMRVEYNAIVEAGFILQLDNPDLPDAWQMYPEMSVADYRSYAKLRAEALNHALRDIPREQITLHCCWGSFHGPHKHDIPLEDILDIIFSVKASRYSIEASNPAHEHEWEVFKDHPLPDGAVLIPGVIGHCTNFIENPKLVAQRLERYARFVGKENVMAGTDCGVGSRVADPQICWAKLTAMSEGAALASSALWKR